MSTPRTIRGRVARSALVVLALAATATGCTGAKVPTIQGVPTLSLSASRKDGLEQSMVDAQTAGNTIADLQNKFATLAPGSDQVTANSAALNAYIQPDAQGAGVPWLAKPKAVWRFGVVTYTAPILVRWRGPA